MPLFSLRSRGGWGIGEIGDIAPFCAWVAAAGHRLLQLLPILEMPPGERSPYAALSAFAIDPLYLSLAAVEDFAAAGGEGALTGAEREALDTARAESGIDYDGMRVLKRRALEIAFTRFLATEWRGDASRARAFRRFREAEASWLADYALFRACQERQAGRAWTAWDAPLRDRVAAALGERRVALARELLFHEYVQWLAAEQWAVARRGAAAAGVRLKGDLPFAVSGNSVDVWSRQAEFSLDPALGAPPDAFSATGQAWGLPVARWDVMERGGLAWLRARATRAAALFDAFRLDHVVGFYRQYVMPCGGGGGAFVPSDEAAQRALGERLVDAIRDAAGSAEVIGEDLGVVPPFVRDSLAGRGVPGYRVLRWEVEGGVFRDPAGYPAASIATTGTHDTSPLAAWWEDELDAGGRRAVAAVASFAGLGDAGSAFTPAVHAALLDGLYAAGSDLVVLPFPDAYGGRERINVPATVGPGNWAYRLPWTLDELDRADGVALRDRLRALARRHGR